MRKIKIMILLLLLVAAIAAVSFPRPVVAANWQVVKTITGSGSITTDEFHIDGSEWRIKWNYSPNSQEPSLTAFSFFVYPHGETTSYVGHVIEYGSANTSGTLDLHEGPRLFYIEILAANTPGYTLTIESDVDSVVSDSLLYAIIATVFAVPIIIIIVIVVALRKKRKRLSMPLPPPPQIPYLSFFSQGQGPKTPIGFKRRSLYFTSFYAIRSF
jgi:hypothetical protein